MLGSSFEAEDAVQETMVRAWRGFSGFEGRSSMRSWLYRIATNVCLDMLRSRQRRARPMDMGPAGSSGAFTGETLPESAWIEPIPDDRVLPEDGDPAELAAARETIRLAFVTALQHLPARQRAVLILREVLRWQATEVAELLETTVASVNSALQRARATLAQLQPDDRELGVVDAEQQALIARYVDAFERYDITSLVALLHEDAVMSMPPYNFWLRGPVEMGRWFLGEGPRAAALASWRRRPTGAQRSARTASTPTAAMRRGPSRSSRSQVTGSWGTTTSSTPPSSRPSAFPHTSTTEPRSGTTSRRPTRWRSSTTSGPG